jgi:hypothetical protein
MIHHLAVAAVLAAQAAPAERPCITHQEAADMAVALLPFLVAAAAQRCRGELAPDAFLNSGAAAWSARLRQDGAPRRDSALRGLAKLGGAAPPPGVDGDVAFQFVAQMMAASMTSNIQPENCAQADTIARSLEPLPTANVASLIVAGLDLAMTTREAAADDEERTSEEDSEDREDASSPPICRT